MVLGVRPTSLCVSIRNVQASFPWLLKSPNFRLLKRDGWEGGPSSLSPYHAIHVGAAAAAVPAALMRQLAPEGIMIIPVECKRGRVKIEGEADREVRGDEWEWGGGQVLVAVKKDANGAISVEYITSVMYVPLVKSR